MLKAVKNLVDANSSIKQGNHKVEHNGELHERSFYYFWTAICVALDRDKKFHIDNGGYSTPSTNRAINDYRHHFISNGYIECDKNWNPIA